jgi:hypothetical protein
LKASTSSVVVCCATDAFGRQPHAAAAVQTRHPDCGIIVAAGEQAVVVVMPIGNRWFGHFATCAGQRCALN